MNKVPFKPIPLHDGPNWWAARPKKHKKPTKQKRNRLNFTLKEKDKEKSEGGFKPGL